MAIAVPSEFAQAHRPRVWSLVPAAATLAVAAAAASLGFGLAAGSPDAVQVFLMEWVAVPYVIAGAIAWWRRPGSRLGPLMVAGGLVSLALKWNLIVKTFRGLRGSKMQQTDFPMQYVVIGSIVMTIA